MLDAFMPVCPIYRCIQTTLLLCKELIIFARYVLEQIAAWIMFTGNVFLNPGNVTSLCHRKVKVDDWVSETHDFHYGDHDSCLASNCFLGLG